VKCRHCGQPLHLTFLDLGSLVERARLGAGESYERLRDNRRAIELYEMIVAAPVDPAMKIDAEERLRRLRK